ncbi:MAG: SulP family inorganic anion transporter [Bacteroidales bacterium]|nr:SulP family inorganic anion transporter [Bacteroidales bacterium]
MGFISTSNLKGDVFGGITAGIVALPLALAFGIQAFGGVNDPNASAVGALAGLVGATMLGFFASLFGGCHSQISGPTGPMTVITASLISGIWASQQAAGASFQEAIPTILLSMSFAGMFCGLFQILFGICKIGKYIRYIPYPVLSGFMSGIGIIIILQQIYPLIGLKSPVLVVDMILQFPERVAANGISLEALLLGLGSIAIIYLFPLITKKIPATLVALIVMTVVSLFLNDFPVNLTIGEIPSGFPLPVFLKEGIDFSAVDWGLVLKSSVIPGLTLAGLGSIDTLLTSVVADSITKTKHDSNKELMGQGIGNAVAALFCGIGGAGATMRTVVNVKSGGRSQISGMVHSLFLLAILLGLGSIVKFVPLSVLAGILISVGVGIIDFRGSKDLFRIPKSDAFVLVIVLLTTVFVDLLTAVGIGMVIACVLFMKRTSDFVENSYTSENLQEFNPHSPWADEVGFPQEVCHKVFIQRLDGPVFFGSITKFNEVMHAVPDEVETVIIRMKRVTFMDQSGLYAMETAIKDMQASGKRVLMTIIQPQPRKMMTKLGIIPNMIPESDTFETFEDCTAYIRSIYMK